MDPILEENPVVLEKSMDKLRCRFPVEDLNFFDPRIDFTLQVSEIMLLDQLARGSYGVVYNGIMNREKYAVKVEDLYTGIEEQVNILSELTILQSLPHEHLVKYFGTGYLSKSQAEAKVFAKSLFLHLKNVS
jgi:serine/threonine protein kinase